MEPITSLSPTQLRRAADLQEKIQDLQKQLNDILGTTESTPTEAPKKRKFSAATRAKMKAAQKARWAAIKGDKAEKPEKPAKRKRKLTPAMKGALETAWAARRTKEAAGKGK